MPTSWIRVAVLLACIAPVAPAQVRTVPLAAGEQRELSALQQPGLEAARAGSGASPSVLAPAERLGLEQLQSSHAGLDALRAGEITDRELELMLITAGVVILIALLL